MEADETIVTPSGHWGTADPAAQPSHDVVAGLPRMVIEAHSRLGPDCSPEQVAGELQQRGLEVTVDEVRAVWPPGG